MSSHESEFLIKIGAKCCAYTYIRDFVIYAQMFAILCAHLIFLEPPVCCYLEYPDDPHDPEELCDPADLCELPAPGLSPHQGQAHVISGIQGLKHTIRYIQGGYIKCYILYIYDFSMSNKWRVQIWE